MEHGLISSNTYIMGNTFTQQEKNLLPKKTLYKSADGFVIDVTGYDKKHYVFKKKDRIIGNLLRNNKKSLMSRRKKRSKV